MQGGSPLLRRGSRATRAALATLALALAPAACSGSTDDAGAATSTSPAAGAAGTATTAGPVDTTSAPAPPSTPVVPVLPASGPVLVALTAGDAHTCGIAQDRSVWCWGENDLGQLGDGTTTRSGTVAVQVQGLGSGASAVAANGTATCAALDTGTVECWGQAPSPDPTFASGRAQPVPFEVGGVDGAREVVLADDYGCALLLDGGVRCWGLVPGTDPGTPVPEEPVDVPALAGVRQLAAGTQHLCGLTAEGAVRCLGADTAGQLGDGPGDSSTTGTDTAVVVPGVTAVQLRASTLSTCATTAGGEVLCWGAHPALAVAAAPQPPGRTQPCYDCPPPEAQTAPVAVEGLASVRDLALGPSVACAVLGGNGSGSPTSVRCWGSDGRAQLGDGEPAADRATAGPGTEVGGVAAPLLGSVGNTQTCVAEGAGGVRCWGELLHDDPTRIQLASTPVPVTFPG